MSQSVESIEKLLLKNRANFYPVVPFDPERDHLCAFDFTENNPHLTSEQIADTESFSRYIQGNLAKHHCRYGIGGYGEHRTLYARSRHYDMVILPGAGGMGSGPDPEPRRLHLGIDIWGPAGTAVYCPLEAIVHSFAFNNQDSDYGATIILSHFLEGFTFHTLYGHLSLNSLKNLQEGMRIRKGELFSEFGMRFENGNWPAHLHVQLIIDMEGWEGDYPGVCKFSEKEQWMKNCPDPDLILNMNQYLAR